MGNQRPSIRTLSDGYKVTHHPPDDKHPEGKMVLLPGQSRPRAKLVAAHEDNHAQLHEQHQEHHRKVARKRDRYAAHPAVPASKRFF